MKISNLEKNFGEFSLRIESLALPPGQIYGIIGPNGSGKTTAIKLIAGLLKPDGGAIDREGLSPRDITLAPRKPYLLHDSVYRNLVYPLRLRGIKPNPHEIDRCLKIAGLENRRDQFALSLSTGEQQKLSLIRALIFSPKLILLDEALSNLDLESVGLFERLILGRQQKEPVTWVIISHQLSHIQRLCSYLFFMHNGTVKAEGPATDVLLRPQNPHLKKYLQHEIFINEDAQWNS
ncbi:MAG: ABC transporter ATP-binding protein [Clostridiales bacterium]|nr:ABC transporter ATP-binding protein [Clostridiales bacterium]